MVTSEDVPHAQRLLQSTWQEGASQEEIEAAEHVIDHDSDEVACPACGTKAGAGSEHCPDCGLRIG